MKILFASLAAEGHLNPLTGIAVHLRTKGHDVRWYTGASMAGKLAKLGIPLLPFRCATEITGENLPTLFPERAKLRGIKQIRFDGEKIMFANVDAYFQDIKQINEDFPFDLLFCDSAFYGARLIKVKLGKRVFALHAGPESMEDAPNLPPTFLGRKPVTTPIGRTFYRILKVGVDRMVNRPLQIGYNQVLAGHGVQPIRWSVLEETFRTADVTFLNGVPGLAYPRDRRNPSVVFAGACHPYRDPAGHSGRLPEQLGHFPSTVLVSQGTVDNVDPGKLMIPALDALHDTDCLVVVATGGRRTAELRRLYPYRNVVITDWIDFNAILPHVDVFICNGGSGSLLLSLSAGVPVVTAGTREGKNDNNAHIEYLGLGINLRTERPTASRIKRAVYTVLRNPVYRRNVGRIREEIDRYHPWDIIDTHLAAVAAPKIRSRPETASRSSASSATEASILPRERSSISEP